MVQEAGSCCCSPPIALLSQGRQVPWVLFQMQWIPGQAWLQDAELEKAAQLGEVYMRTSLSSRLLKPPNTYITLRDKRRRLLEDYRGEVLRRCRGIQEVRPDDFYPAENRKLATFNLSCTVRAREA